MLRFRRDRMAPHLVLAGLIFGMLGIFALARGNGTAGSQDPPRPPDPQAPPPLDAPRAEPLPPTPDAEPVPDRGALRRDRTEVEASADAPATTTAERVYVPHEPPAPIAERPSRNRPGPRAVWTPGYWEWDADSSRFVWVGGSWQVPPAGLTWQPGRWTRDSRGWYWTAGSWSRRAARPALAAERPAWRIDGPPVEHPDDTPPPAPGPDFFYVPGHYAPTRAGDRLSWVPGFWSGLQPGWDWIPARWVRLADGWDYREGHWIRDPGDIVVERVPSRRPRRMRPNTDMTVITRDPITGAEVDVETVTEPLPPGAVAAGMPYYVIRRPGYPYGPGGVVVPGAVPPFVRRILDRVLP